MLHEPDARRAIEAALKATSADSAEVTVWWQRTAATRFAVNAITQNVDTSDRGLMVSVAFDSRTGSASTNAFDEPSVRAVVRRAEDNARVSPPDPEYLPPLPPADFHPFDPWSEATVRTTAEDRARAVLSVVGRAKDEGLSAAGVIESSHGAGAFGNSAGLFVYERGTRAGFSATLSGSDSSGWASRSSHDAGAIDVAALLENAVARARAAREPKEWPPGRYATILEPAATSAIVSMLGWGLSAREVDAGRSFLSGRKDAKLFDPRIVLRSDPFHPQLLGSRWFGAGIPQRTLDWVRDGRFQSLHYDRFTAKKHGVEPTPWPSTLVLDGGTDSVEKMIASIERGILVTHFWYIRPVDPMKPLFTGMTRDGLLAIEDGKIAGGLKSFRWNENPIEVLNAIEMAGEPEPAEDAEAHPSLVPPVKVREFNFTSGTLF